MTGSKEPLRGHTQRVSSSFPPSGSSLDYWQEHYHTLFFGDREEEKVGPESRPQSPIHISRRSRMVLDPIETTVNSNMVLESRQAPLSIEFIIVGGGEFPFSAFIYHSLTDDTLTWQAFLA
jgi:hypothetical protein